VSGGAGREPLLDLPPNAPVSTPCGCNAPGAVHERGDAAFCRDVLAQHHGRPA